MADQDVDLQLPDRDAPREIEALDDGRVNLAHDPRALVSDEHEGRARGVEQRTRSSAERPFCDPEVVEQRFEGTLRVEEVEFALGFRPARSRSTGHGERDL